jgi:membrane protein DedA with SNARE-associated domain
MDTGFIEQLAKFIISAIQASGYVGIFLLMTLESALVPLPSEVTMPFSGFLVDRGVLNFWTVVAAGAVGNLIGSLIAYYIGFLLEEAILHSLIRRFGKFILLTMEDYEKGELWFRRHGELIAFTSRLIPGVRTFISLACGVSEMNVFKFSLYTFAGSFLWSALLTFIGVKLGENWHILSDYVHKFDLVIALILFGAILFYLWHRWPRKSRSEQTAE